MKAVITITANVTPEGNLTVDTTGPFEQPGLCLRMLTIAEATVKNTAIQNELAAAKSAIVVAPAGALPPTPRFNGGR